MIVPLSLDIFMEIHSVQYSKIKHAFKTAVEASALSFSQDDHETYFLEVLDNMNVNTTFPTPPVMTVSSHDHRQVTPTSETALQTMNRDFTTYLEQLELPDMTQDAYDHRVRQYFDYEVRDTIAKIFTKSPITNAWCKMYELLGFLKDDLSLQKQIRTFHICEHPGAFVYAIRDYLVMHRLDATFVPVIQSLKEGNFKKLDDVERDFPQLTVDYGIVGDGDVTNEENISYYAHKYQDPYLTTSDCGLDSSDDFLNQEAKIYPIFKHAFRLAVRARSQHYISKLFSLYTVESKALIYAMTLAYTTVRLVKPLMSRYGSFEAYVVCAGRKDVTVKTVEEALRSQNIPRGLDRRLHRWNKIMTRRRLAFLYQKMFLRRHAP